MLISTRKLKELDNAWLSPEGKIIIGAEGLDPFAYHLELAYYILCDLYKLFEKEDYKYWDEDFGMMGYQYTREQGFEESTRLLESLGWMRLHGSGGRYGWVRGWIKQDLPDGVPTYYKENEVQAEIIKKWCQYNKIPIDRCFLYM